MRNHLIAAAVSIFMALTLSACVRGGGKAYDTVLLVRPVIAKPIEKGAQIDAIEKGLQHEGWPTAVVTFKVEKVLSGKFPEVRTGGPGRWEQAREAGRSRNILKILTLDFEDPDETRPREWIRVAVANTIDSFGIRTWDAPEGGSGRLYLKEVTEEPGTFVMVKYRR